MPQPSHTVRNSLASKERTYHLSTDALQWEADGSQVRVAYADIDQMQLISYANFGGMQGQCTLHTRSGEKICIRSHHYAGLNNFEDRSATYAPFITGLARQIASSSPNARFVKGSTGLVVVWLVVLALCAGTATVLAIALLEDTPIPVQTIAGVAVIATFGTIAWRMVRGNDQTGFDPADIPSELLCG
jgi:hypothetical protein